MLDSVHVGNGPCGWPKACLLHPLTGGDLLPKKRFRLTSFARQKKIYQNGRISNPINWFKTKFHIGDTNIKQGYFINNWVPGDNEISRSLLSPKGMMSNIVKSSSQNRGENQVYTINHQYFLVSFVDFKPFDFWSGHCAPALPRQGWTSSGGPPFGAPPRHTWSVSRGLPTDQPEVSIWVKFAFGPDWIPIHLRALSGSKNTIVIDL